MQAYRHHLWLSIFALFVKYIKLILRVTEELIRLREAVLTDIFHVIDIKCVRDNKLIACILVVV